MWPGGVATPPGRSAMPVAAKLGSRCMPKGTSRSSSRQVSAPRSSRKRRATPNFYTLWEPWPDVVARVRVHIKSPALARIELTRRLQLGEIKSLLRVVELRADKVRDHTLTREFWKEVRISSTDDGLQVNLRAFLHKKWKEKAPPPWAPEETRKHLLLFGVQF